MTVDKGIFIKNVYYMLSYAFRILRQQDYENIAAESFDNINDMFAEIISRGTSRQLKQGLYKEYISRRDELSVIRGKIDISGTISKRTQKSNNVICDFDDFSENNIYNRILKTTIFYLSRADDVKNERRQNLKKLLVFFGNVDMIRPDSIKWSRLTYRRNNRNYELLLNMCFFVLSSLIQTTEKGEYRLASFSEEHMERLFEKFILEYYKQHHSELSPSAPEIKWNVPDSADKSLLPVMKTDIVLHKNGRTLIIDAKYYGRSLASNYDKSTLRSAHLYQIFAYVKNYDRENTGNVSGLLIYAKTDDEIFPEGEPFMIGGNSIGAKTLDLNRDFADISNRLDMIAAEYFENM